MSANKDQQAQPKRRSKGERTRESILNAAIIVLAQNGIKGTTHRAVAQQAQLQLSLTTYYFKDIQELIQQAFILNSNAIMATAMTAWQQTFDALSEISLDQSVNAETRLEIATQLTSMARAYIDNKLRHEPTSLAVEQLLFTEVHRAPELADLADKHWLALREPFVRMCQHLAPADAETHAEIMLTLFTQIEYRHLAVAVDDIDWLPIEAMIKKVMSWLLNI
ncbi:TetR family transcriptional regulator [Endozoicomonas sp. G2_1]|uniref:TetR/AcrR family transcriptional regulator n=1 Tax=Endozoicomonas sp. G2_1 TaxID=2821091 RepID=UPI001ADAAEC9|nr:TetR family transcriptional regulator [Endozoicomonas sp. G2_1]MBO9490808.1 TetR family transcriptional regulator [Endozoicomonas sp. G2_1]